jgi:hypothetical protein
MRQRRPEVTRHFGRPFMVGQPGRRGAFVRQLKLESDTKVLIGAPADPPPKSRVRTISAIFADIEEIREAHLPLMYAPKLFDRPVQVLVIVIEPFSAMPQVMATLGNLCTGYR